MPDPHLDAVETEGDDAVDKQVVERERADLREFVAGLSPDEIKSGGWFTKLSAQALATYTNKVDWQYFQERYQGVPADAIVDQRIKMAARYAALEGGLSASAYTATIAATIGSLGAASPAGSRLRSWSTGTRHRSQDGMPGPCSATRPGSSRLRRISASGAGIPS